MQMRNRSMNRYLEDGDLDDVDHALGRPKDPLGETYRNYYCLDASGPLAKRMRASEWWEEGCTINEGRNAIFHVTGEGRKALAKYLAELE